MAENTAKRRAVGDDGPPQAVHAPQQEDTPDGAGAAAAADEGGEGVPLPFRDGAQMTWFFDRVDEIGEKLYECIPPWAELLASDRYKEFFDLLTAVDLGTLALPRVSAVLVVLIAAFQSLELEPLRQHFWPLTHFALFSTLSPRRLAFELAATPELRKPVAKIQRRVERDPTHLERERTYLPSLVAFFLMHLARTDALLADPEADAGAVRQHTAVCCRFLEFVTDLLCQMPTRRFFRAFAEDTHIAVHCGRSRLASAELEPERGALFRDMLSILRFYHGFEVDDHTSEALTENECETRHAARVTVLQRVAWKFYREKLRDLSMGSAAALEERALLQQYLRPLSDRELAGLCVRLCVLDEGLLEHVPMERGFLLELLLLRHERRVSEAQRLHSLALYPDENLLWNYAKVPEEHYSGSELLALPKLNLQFCTIQDYLLRNFNLMRLESAYEVREDIAESLQRLQPRPNPDDGAKVVFTGRARMVLPVQGFSVTKVALPGIGFTRPAEVRAELRLSLEKVWPPNVREEWEQLRQHDVLMLIGLRPTPYDPDEPDPRKRFGITCVRGCEIMDTRDDEDNVFTGLGDSGVRLRGHNRTYRVQLDPAQYQQDINAGLSPYDSFTIVMRRKPKENNFKAVLETIRDLMTFPTVVPEWLHDIFLGYGDPDSAHYSKMEGQLAQIDFVDTLIDAGHVTEAFPGKQIVWRGCSAETAQRPFKVAFPVESEESDGEQPGAEAVPQGAVAVEPYQRGAAGPYPEDAPKQNSVRFTAAQVEAIRSASSPGLTVIVGPPGTGKTDVAVQIISNIYHNFPNQRTLVVTHSNAALNDIFEKTVEKDIDERYMLRLGMGEKELETQRDYSKWGRVNYMLERRLALLERVERLAKSLEVDPGFAYTCETSEHFYLHHVLSRWEKFQQGLEGDGVLEWVTDNFPFTRFFDDTPTPFWDDATDFASAAETARRGWAHIQRLFTELAECKAFELLRSSHDRGNYLVAKQAKVIAMTCTHAALKRRDFIRLGFKYDNLVMEEAAQILEVETFVPMLLQQPGDTGASRLKRVVLIGDHHQLPPVVKNLCFQKYCHMDQSLFTRFVRLGVPTVQLDAQGRMRTELADLFRWRYKELRDLPHVQREDRFGLANAGFALTHQCIDVGDFRGQGESQPQPHFYQNLGEAEYVVATYMYMRLLGYPAKSISILTTYNGQKHLIRDVLQHRCGPGTIFGALPIVSTVDKYQGRQNDYVLLSLVRTERVGHLRDPRRLVVALSRARLGLYVFCRVSLFRSVWELRPAFNLLLRLPTALALAGAGDGLPEWHPTARQSASTPPEQHLVKDVVEMGELIGGMTKGALQAEADRFTEKERADRERMDTELASRMRGRFERWASWDGPRKGWYFGNGDFGVGYYKDPRPLPEYAPPAAAPPAAQAVQRPRPGPRPVGSGAVRALAATRRRIDVEEESSDGDQDPVRAPPQQQPPAPDAEDVREQRRREAAELRELQRRRALTRGGNKGEEGDDEDGGGG
eukprot:TRINITY_DN6533_c0_g1_i3.p1 TRINITY_DN6533_c0_g1~~TRINITY_DN6533_c0_g1_i3.p1  ORF type:complete len:1505 (+),score=516.09 TRINITY_DN6533_c0_g1_i3:74-4588(+)